MLDPLKTNQNIAYRDLDLDSLLFDLERLERESRGECERDLERERESRGERDFDLDLESRLL